jgi:hypothetical protein
MAAAATMTRTLPLKGSAVDSSDQQQPSAMLTTALIESVCAALNTVPVNKVVQTVRLLINKLSVSTSLKNRFEVPAHVGHSTTTMKTEASDGPPSNSVAQHTSNSEGNAKIDPTIQFLTWFQEYLQGVGAILDETLASMQEDCIDVNVSLAGLLRIKANTELKEVTTEFGKRPEISDEKSSKPHTAAVEGIQEDDEEFIDPRITLRSEHPIWWMTQAITDLQQCFRDSLDRFMALPERTVLRGVVDLHPNDVRAAITHMKGNCRYTYVTVY